MKVLHLITLVFIPVAIVLSIVSLAGPSIPWSSVVDDHATVDFESGWSAWNPYNDRFPLNYFFPGYGCNPADGNEIGMTSSWEIRRNAPVLFGDFRFELDPTSAPLWRAEVWFWGGNNNSFVLLFNTIFSPWIPGNYQLQLFTSDEEGTTNFTLPSNTALYGGYHFYDIHWEMGLIVVRVDGVAVMTVTSNVPHRPVLFEIIQLCAGLVDYFPPAQCQYDPRYATFARNFSLNGATEPFCQFPSVGIDAAPLRGKLCLGGESSWPVRHEYALCDQGGKGVVALVALGVVACFFTVGVVLWRAKHGKMRRTAVGAPVVAALLFMAGMILWSEGCGKTLRQNVDSDFRLDTGFYLTLGAFLIALLIAVLQSLVQKSLLEGQPSHIPTVRSKRLHLASIVLCYMALVMSVTAVCNVTVSWSKLQGDLSETGGDSSAIVTVGLLEAEICYGGLAVWSDTAPSECVQGGKAVVALSGVAIVLLGVSTAAVFYRAHTTESLGKRVAAVVLLLLACLFQLLPFVLWMHGCHARLQEYDGGITTDIGFNLSVLSFVFVLLSFLMELVTRHVPLTIHGDHQLPGQAAPDTAAPGAPANANANANVQRSSVSEPPQSTAYYRLADSDVPYL